MDVNLKKQIMKSAAIVKKKVKMINDIKNTNDTVIKNIFKPIVDPLNKIAVAREQKNKNFKRDIVKHEDDCSELSSDEFKKLYNKNKDFNKTLTSVSPKDSVKKKVTYSSSEDDDNNDDSSEEHDLSDTSFKSVDSAFSPQSQSMSRSLSPEVLGNIPFGIRSERGKLMMGNMRVYDEGKNINIGGHILQKTPGIKELLFKKVPDLSLITEEDKEKYKFVLTLTNAHRRNFNANKPIKSNKGLKYVHIIKPLFKYLPSNVGSFTENLSHGKGLPLLKTMKKNTDFIYWDDPNELIERLRLLMAAREAGNTGLDNEIISIIEELREANIIN